MVRQKISYCARSEVPKHIVILCCRALKCFDGICFFMIRRSSKRGNAEINPLRTVFWFKKIRKRLERIKRKAIRLDRYKRLKNGNDSPLSWLRNLKIYSECFCDMQNKIIHLRPFFSEAAIQRDHHLTSYRLVTS